MKVLCDKIVAIFLSTALHLLTQLIVLFFLNFFRPVIDTVAGDQGSGLLGSAAVIQAFTFASTSSNSLPPPGLSQ